MGFKSVLILSEMVYVKPMHEDCFSLVSDSFGIRGNRGRGEDETKQEKRETAAPLLLRLWDIYSLGPRKK